MKTKIITISKGQYLSDILTELPTNAIILKTATGIGATTLELFCERHSIIIEPNVPVIKGKKGKGILGIFEGIDVPMIMDYLRNDSIEFKKILVTPESFCKVLEAANNLNINLYSDYFLLFDECDRTMKDVNYRYTIIKPMQNFFSFENKAFISATAVIPSDPRFEEHKFQNIIIKPDYDYQKGLELIVTNNISQTLKNVVESLESERICIFYNSLQGIVSTINDLGIADQTSIYCSSNKGSELSINGINGVYDNLTEEFPKHNFFTSRFNAAVDIEMDIQPVVIMVTNLHIAHHTMIDPKSDAIQIVGRFRNGVDRIIAISNFDSTLKTKDENEAISYLEGCEETYNVIKALHQSATNPGAEATLAEALLLVKYSDFVNEDGTKNHFMYDNFFYEEAVKALYLNHKTLFEAYKTMHFLPTLRMETHLLSDADLKPNKYGLSIRELTSQLIDALNKLEQEDDMKFVIDNKQDVINQLERNFPDIVRGYYELGAEQLYKNSYSKKQLKTAVRKKREAEQKSNFAFIQSLYNSFEDGFEATTKIIISKLELAIKKHDLDLKPSLTLLKYFFHLGPRKTIKGGKEQKGYKIIGSKFNREIGQNL